MFMDTLQTARLILRPFTMDDLPDLYRLLDLDLEWAGPGISIDQRKEKMQFQIALSQWKDTGCIYGDRVIVLKATGQLIGICGFRPWICTPAERALYDPPAVIHEHPLNAPELGVGYALSSQHRGHGYATEAVRALIEYGFTALQVRRIVALTFRGNTDSVNVMKRVGMKVGVNPDPEAIYPWVVSIVENNRTQTIEAARL
jgi:RimJ/RimL family protein N-acetyltransferase